MSSWIVGFLTATILFKGKGLIGLFFSMCRLFQSVGNWKELSNGHEHFFELLKESKLFYKCRKMKNDDMFYDKRVPFSRRCYLMKCVLAKSRRDFESNVFDIFTKVALEESFENFINNQNKE